MKYNVFLPDINNMKPVKNPLYKANLMSLNAFVMVMFLQDTMVQPKESEVHPSRSGSYRITLLLTNLLACDCALNAK